MATKRWDRGRRRRTILGTIIVVGVSGLLAACGSGATSGPSEDSLDPRLPGADDPERGEEGTDGGIEFSFQLPTGPVGPTSEDDPVFEAFRDIGCDAANDELDRLQDVLDSRAALLYRAAIHLCWGQTDEARQQFDQVTLPLWAQACPWYQAIGSVLQQQQPSSIYCPVEGGDNEGNGGEGNGDPGDGNTGDGNGDNGDAGNGDVTEPDDGAGEPSDDSPGDNG